MWRPATALNGSTIFSPHVDGPCKSNELNEKAIGNQILASLKKEK